MKTPEEIAKHIKVTKIVSTRSVKTRKGDSYTGFTASWDSVQDDDPSGDEPVPTLTLEEAEVAHLLLARQTDISAYQMAMANNSISPSEGMAIIANISRNYNQLINQLYNTEDTDV